MLTLENLFTMYSHDGKAEQIIEELLKLLGDEYIYNCIVRPIEKVALEFEPPLETPISYRSFVNAIGRFVQSVFKYGLRVKKDIAKDQARSVAYMILESGYVGKNSRGFHAAYLDAIDPEINGFDLILSQMTEMLSSMEHTKHTKWVLQNHLGCLGWQTKCGIVEVILSRMSPHLPDSLARCDPSMLCDHIEGLLNLLVASEKAVDKLLSEGTG